MMFMKIYNKHFNVPLTKPIDFEMRNKAGFEKDWYNDLIKI